ncbi:hypothetical protein Tco_0631278 [Tanacetum coccineum]
MDNGTEFKNKEVIDCCGIQGIKREIRNQANLHAGQQEANQNAGTEETIDVGDSDKEDDSTQDCFVLPIWPSYSSTNTPAVTTDDKRAGPREEEQVFMDDLERLKRQEKEANEEAEVLRKKFETLVIKEGAAKPSISTASPYEGLSLADTTHSEEDDSEIPPLKDIYQNPLKSTMDVKIASFMENWRKVYVSQPPVFKITKYPKKVDKQGTIDQNFSSKEKKMISYFSSRCDDTAFGLQRNLGVMSLSIKEERISDEFHGIAHVLSLVYKSMERKMGLCPGANLDRNSTQGGCQFLAELISCKQEADNVATATTEAEYVAASKLLWQVCDSESMFRLWFNFMNTKSTLRMRGTICIVKNPVNHFMTKHNAIMHHFIRDGYEKKLLQVLKIHTDTKELIDRVLLQKGPSEAQTYTLPWLPLVKYLMTTDDSIPCSKLVRYLLSYNLTGAQPNPSPNLTLTTILASIPESSVRNLGGSSSNAKSLSGNEGDMTIQGQRFPRKASSRIIVHKSTVPNKEKVCKRESSVQRDPLFDEMPEDTIDHMEIENAQREGRTREMGDEDKDIDERYWLY